MAVPDGSLVRLKLIRSRRPAPWITKWCHSLNPSGWAWRERGAEEVAAGEHRGHRSHLVIAGSDADVGASGCAVGLRGFSQSLDSAAEAGDAEQHVDEVVGIAGRVGSTVPVGGHRMHDPAETGQPDQIPMKVLCSASASRGSVSVMRSPPAGGGRRRSRRGRARSPRRPAGRPMRSAPHWVLRDRQGR